MAENTTPPVDSSEGVYHHEEFKLPAKERDALYRSVLESSLLDPEYLTMLVLSGLLALFGLLQNNVAVIIGAMLISPFARGRQELSRPDAIEDWGAEQAYLPRRSATMVTCMS
jgi:hypothetical protein